MNQGNLGLQGKTALVTGSSRGIGRAIAYKLAEEGAFVALNSSRDASETERIILEAGGQCRAYVADISVESQVNTMFGSLGEERGGVDILVNNAGVNRDTLLLRLSEDDWDSVLGTDLKGVFLCTRAAVKLMVRRRWGRILNIGSVVGLRGNAGQSNYTAAKSGLIGFTRSVAQEVASRNITANIIAPGFITTDMTDNLTADQRESIRCQIPLGAFGTPEDVAEVAKFLADDAAAYITGQVIHVDGGLVLA